MKIKKTATPFEEIFAPVLMMQLKSAISQLKIDQNVKGYIVSAWAC